MATTVGNLIASSMRKAGILAKGEPIPSDAGGDLLESFRQMVDSWTNESLLIPASTVVTKTLIPNTSEYTIGIYPPPDPPPANHIEVARPEEIRTAFIRDTYGTDYPVKPMTVNTWGSISQKGNGSRPSRFYIRYGWPLSEILFDSVPYADEVLHLECLLPFGEYLETANLTDVVNLPPGYERALIYNFIAEISEEYGKSISNVNGAIAVSSKKRLKRSNYQPRTLHTDRGLANQDRARGTYIIEQGP